MSHLRKVVDTTRGLILLLGAIGITLALVVAALTVALQAQSDATQASKRATAVALEQAREAKSAAVRAQATAAAIGPPVCHLVYTYENLKQASANKTQVSVAWRGVGLLVGCPDGIKPPVSDTP